jgi:hypothetical protein
MPPLHADTRMVDSGLVKRALLASAIILFIGCSTVGNRPLVTKIPGDRREFEIVQVDYSPRQAAVTATFSSAFGIFAFDLNPDGRRLKQLTLIIENQHYWEGLSFEDRSGHSTDLLHVEGVQVRQQDSNIVIQITAPAMELFKEGGRVQFVNQYR